MLRRSLLAAAAIALLTPAAASADRLTVRGTQVFRSVVPNTPTQPGNEFAAFNGFLYFVANDDLHGNELWRTDGTNEGTALVSDIYPGLPNTNSNPHNFTVVGSRLFFNAYNAASQSSETVYYIDAATPTTVKQPNAKPVTNAPAIPAVGSIFGAPNGRLVISRLLGENQNCCYSAYALPPGGTLLEKISVGADDVGTNNSFSPSATAGGWTYYSRSNTNVSPGEGAEPWRTNGSVTQAVANIYPGNGGSSPRGFVATSDKVYFTADDGTHGRELWVTDPANPSDTHIVREHVPGTAATSIDDPGAAANGNVLYYTPANDPVTGSEVWRTDGTEAGTRVVKDITPGVGGQSGPVPFAFRGGVGILRGGSIFGSTDGSEGGTSLLGEVDGDGYGVNSPVVLGDNAYFVGGATPFGQALWRTDGTASGTLPLSAGGFDGTPATSGSPSAQSLAVLGNKLIFFGRDPETQNTGWVKLFVVDTSQPDEVRTATVAPAITGKAEVSQVLEVSPGSWSGRPTSYGYQWLRNGQPIAGATNGGYYTGAADVGQTISARVTTRGIGAPREATADAAGVVIAGSSPSPIPAPAPIATPVPRAPGTVPGKPTTPAVAALPLLKVKKKGSLNGTARVGATLTLKRPTFDRAGVKLTFRWTAGGKTIAKQTKSTLKLTKAQAGKTITLVITAKKAGYSSLEFKVGPTAKVKPARRR